MSELSSFVLRTETALVCSNFVPAGEPGFEPDPGDPKSPVLACYTTPQCVESVRC